MGVASENADINRQIVSRDGEDNTYGPVNTTVDAQYDRDYELSFVLSSANDGSTTSLPSESDVKLTTSVSKDGSNKTRTLQTFNVAVRAKWAYGEVTIKVSAKSKVGQVQSITLAEGKVPANQARWGVDMGGDTVDYNTDKPASVGQKIGNVLFNSSTATSERTRSQYAQVQTTNPKTSYTWYTWFDGGKNKKISGSSNYFLSEIKLNGQIIAVPFPEHNFKPSLQWNGAADTKFLVGCQGGWIQDGWDDEWAYYVIWDGAYRIVYDDAAAGNCKTTGSGRRQVVRTPVYETRTGDASRWNTQYRAWETEVQANRTTPLLNYTVESGANAGATIKVYVEGSRVLADGDTNSLLTTANDYTAPTTNADFYNDGLTNFIVKTLYRIEVTNLPALKNTFKVSWDPDANSWVSNLDATGFVSPYIDFQAQSGGSDPSTTTPASGAVDGALAINMGIRPDSSETTARKWNGYRPVCSTGKPCERQAKAVWLPNRYQIFYRFQNGWGPVPESQSNIVVQKSDGSLQATSPDTDTTNVYGRDMYSVSLDRPGLVTANDTTYQAFRVGYLASANSNTLTATTIGAGTRQIVRGLAKPFEFSVTEKVNATDINAPNLQTVEDGRLVEINPTENLNVQDNTLIQADPSVPALSSGEAFLGYSMYACTDSECYPMHQVSTPLDDTCKTSDMANGRDPDSVIFPGESVRLSEWNLCWQNTNGVQAIKEIRFVPASKIDAGSLTDGTYWASLRQIGNNDAAGKRVDNEFRGFWFQGVPGIGVRFTNAWLTANKTADVPRADSSVVTLGRNDGESTLTLDKTSATNASTALVAMYGEQTSLKVNLKWTNTGEPMAEPSNATTKLTLDGVTKDFGKILAGYGEGRLVDLKADIKLTGSCTVSSVKLTGPGHTEGTDLTDGVTDYISVAKDASSNEWTVTADVDCPMASLTLNKTFNKRVPQTKTDADPITWWDLKAQAGDADAINFTSGTANSEVPAGTYKLIATKNSGKVTETAPFIDDAKWVCTKDDPDGTTKEVVNNTGELTIGSGENWSCDFASTVAELTMLAYIPGDDSAVEAAKWKLTATPKQTTAMAAGRVNVLAADATLEPVSVTGSRVLAEDSTVFTRPGTTYSFTAEGGALYTKTAQYYDEDAYGAYDPAYLTDDSKWVDVLSTGLTMPTDGKKHYIVRFKIEPVFTASLPLTGGTAKDLYLGLGGIFLAAAAAGIYVIKRRRSRLA